MGRSDRFDQIWEKENRHLTCQTRFGGKNLLPTAREVDSIGGESGSVGDGKWVELVGSLDSPRLVNEF